ncbi:MAG: thiol:disulfide interchange protein [Cryomorphaceae bacterium]|nr:MAG: thiol:disulfide interchange protein [Cryomorphaceae bacterium]
MLLRFTAFLSLLSLFAIAWPTYMNAQIYDPVKWSFSVDVHDGKSATLVLQADIQKGWHVYATELPSDDGPIATSFEFEPSGAYALDGKIQEPKFITKFDPNFDMELNFHDNQAIFRQKVDLLSSGAFTIKGMLTFMTCDDEKCLPPEDVNFTFEIPARESSTQGMAIPANQPPSGGMLEPVKWDFSIEDEGNNNFVFVAKATIDEHWHLYSQHLESLDGPIPTEFLFEQQPGLELVGVVEEPTPITAYDSLFEMMVSYFDKEAEFRQKFRNTGGLTALKGSVGFMACDDERCIFPDPEEFNESLPGVEPVDATAAITPTPTTPDRSLLGIFIIAFFGGFAALLTPCVFPMIPMTVSFFTKQSKTRAKGVTNAMIYALSIIFIYVLLGFGVTVIFGADALNAMSTNVWFNLAFFLLLVIFAISFFGAFEITLPSSFINKVDKNADRGGLIGIFFMAFTLALVSFSCTGPIIGTLLVEAAYVGGKSGPLVGMFGFSLALALPFGLFAAFPGWLNSLPQSGGWLNSVKVVLGFLELALAFKFLSNADLVVQAGIITREVFISIWIAVFGVMALYLFGAFRLPHDSPVDRLSVGRLLFGILTVTFTIYLIPGLWGAPLKIISGFPPPMFYSESPDGFGSSTAVVQVGEGGTPVKSGKGCPHNLQCFKDYDEGLAYAKEVGKPVLLDFTGWACVNCRKMEEQVWSHPDVLSRLREDVVLISLYVDDKRALPAEEQVEVTIGTKTRTLKTIGNKWSHFQADRYQSNSQPLYVLMDHDEQNLVEPTAYDLDVQRYVDWLDAGKAAFEKRNP